MSKDPAEHSAGFETRQIHAGEIIDAEANARVTPIYQTAGYQFKSFDDGEERFAGRSTKRAYSRNDNPTNIVAGRRLASLEGGVDGIVVGSGQAAIAVALFALASAGDHILATTNLYEGTREMFAGALKRQGLTVEYVVPDATAEEWAARITPRTKAVYTETIPNPRGDINDLESLAAIAHAAGVPLVVDACGAGAYLAYLRTVVVLEYGPTVPPTSTFLLLQGIETLSLRMERHVANAQSVAEAIAGHPALAAIHYPGLSDNPFHDRALKYLPQGAGSIVAIDLAGGKDAARRFIDALQLVSPMTHIGDVRSLAIHSASTIHGKLSEEQRLALGITPGLVRLSIGIETAADIIADVTRALDAALAG